MSLTPEDLITALYDQCECGTVDATKWWCIECQFKLGITSDKFIALAIEDDKILKSRTEDELERLQKYQHHHEEIHFVEEQRLRAIADAAQAKLSTYKEALEMAEKALNKIEAMIFPGMSYQMKCGEIRDLSRAAITLVRKALEPKA